MAIAQRASKAVFIILLAVLAVAGKVAYAQASLGAITGTVRDSTGAVVPQATLTITNEETGVGRTLKTDSSGFYSDDGLTTGLYSVNVSAPGFEKSVIQHLLLNPGERRANNITLNVGSTSAEVTVSATAQAVNTETSELGSTIDSKQIDNLQLNGRNFQTLAIGIPGVASTVGADALNGGGLEGGTTLIVNGMSVEYTTYTIDGVYNMNSGNLSNINILPIVDTISEFSVLTDNYSAKYGFAGSGQTVVATKTGTNTFHGTAWDYLRNTAFDANNYFSTSTQALHQNIYGYTFGGPLIIPKLYNTDRTKRTFFFASNQWYTISAGQVARGAVFNSLMRTGNLSTDPTLKAPLTLDPSSAALLASEGRTNCITGPTSLNPACLDPVAKALINTYSPLPNNAAYGFLNYINQGNLITHQLDYVDRIDHNINNNNLLTGRLMYEQVLNGFPYDAWGGMPYSTYTDAYYTPALNALIRVESTITPNLVNTASVAETYDKPRINPTTSVVLPSGVSIVQAFPSAPSLDRMPNVSISEGWTGFGVGSEPITASDGEGIVQDDVSWVHKDHVFSAGALYVAGIKRQNVFTNPQGSFNFDGVHTGDPAADFLLGLHSSYSQASSQKLGNFHYREVDLYGQDDWRVTPRLTLNLGLRWVYFSNDTVSGDQVTSFNPALYNSLDAPVTNINGSLVVNAENQPLTASGTIANTLNGLEQAGQNGVSSGFFNPDKANYGPRVGFAYDVFGDGKTSVRGGYGIGYSRIPLEQIYAAFGQNPPYNSEANVLNSVLDNGTIGAAAHPTTQSLDNVPFSFVPVQIQSYSLSIQRQIIPNMVATIAYAGSQGRHLETFQGGYDGNFALPVTAPSTSGCLAPGQSASSSYQFDPCINVGIASEDHTRPYQGYSYMYDEYDEGSSNYNALESSLVYRGSALQFTLAYTYQKALATIGAHGAGNTTSQSVPAQNMRDFHLEYGPPSYDFTNDIASTWVYNLPFFNHAGSRILRNVLGNWAFSGLALHQSGFAMSPANDLSTAGLAIRPNQALPYSKVGKLGEWFNTNDFTQPLYGFFGNSSNGSIRGPGYTSFNVTLAKTWMFKGRFATQFRAEAFNVANKPNFESVDTGLGDGEYGQVTSAGDPRILEFALKLSY